MEELTSDEPDYDIHEVNLQVARRRPEHRPPPQRSASVPWPVPIFPDCRGPINRANTIKFGLPGQPGINVIDTAAGDCEVDREGETRIPEQSMYRTWRLAIRVRLEICLKSSKVLADQLLIVARLFTRNEQWFCNLGNQNLEFTFRIHFP